MPKVVEVVGESTTEEPVETECLRSGGFKLVIGEENGKSKGVCDQKDRQCFNMSKLTRRNREKAVSLVDIFPY